MVKETRVTYGLGDIMAIELRCNRDGCDGVGRIPVDYLEGHKRRCPKCGENFESTVYTSLLICIQKLVGIGPDAGEQLDFEVRLEYPGEDQGPQVL